MFSRWSLALIVPVLFLSCSRPAPTVAAKPSDPPPPSIFADSAPRSREANDVGRFLAGLPGTEGSPFKEFEEKEAWKLHKHELDADWQNIETKTIAHMREFQKSEIGSPTLVKNTVFYPFSGPDALMLTVFFPHNPVYVMVALEPPGTLPSVHQFAKKADLNKALASVRETAYDELHRSFFITHQMDRQFRGQVTDGLLPPILLLLARSGHTILGYRFVQLDNNGKIVDRGAETQIAGNRGVQVDFSTDADNSVHKLYYFSTNLDDKHLQANANFQAFMKEMKGVDSYFKATSYMTHRAEFSEIRKLTLDHSAAVLQDDSGIPYHFFTEQAWAVQLYGDYTRPYGSFRWLEQPDLKKAYGEPTTKPLPFQIGYGFRKVPSNLLFAQKSGTTTARSEPPPKQ